MVRYPTSKNQSCFDPSLNRFACLTTLNSCDTTKQSFCLL